MREADLRVGFYFSLIDWHHPDYPAFTEADKPYRFDKIHSTYTPTMVAFS